MGGGVSPEAPAQGERLDGFPAGALATAVPNLFFARVLPEVEGPAELVVSLYLFYLNGLARRGPRVFTRRRLLAEGALMRALAKLSGLPPEEALARGLEAAVRRGTLLAAPVRERGEEAVGYLLNTEANRRAAQRLATEEVALPEPPPAAEAGPLPNIFALYEENVGSITPLIAEELKEAEERYPPAWIEAAFREAVSLNKRSWRYIHRILRRWETEGPDYEASERDSQAAWLERRYARGKGRRRERRGGP